MYQIFSESSVPSVLVLSRSSRLMRAAFPLTFPLVGLLLRQAHLREDAIDVLRDQIVDRLRLMIEGHNRRHDHGSSLLRAQHIFKMNPAERRIAHAKQQSAP